MKKRLLIATGNAGKVAEFRELLGAAVECVSLKDPSLAGVKCPEVVEDGETYFENCLKKAVAYQAAYRMPVLADDSGIEVAGLEGGPGVHTAHFGGDALPWPQRWELMIGMLRGREATAWRARFRCVLCYYDGSDVPRFFQGTAEGYIVERPAGAQGFGYDPIFHSDVLGKTFGESTHREKESVSHRGVAARNFLKWAEGPA